MSDEEKIKIEMEYPCAWVYKIIGINPDEMRCAIAEIIQDRRYEISLSRSSQTDKYTCLNVELIVENECHRTTLYEALKAHRAIKLIL